MAHITGLLETVIRSEHDEHNHDDDHDDEGSTVTAKVVAMCVLFLASLTLGCLPIIIAKRFKMQTNPKNNILVNLLLCFGGGVLLCTTFLHLLPEVSEHVGSLQETGDLPEMNTHFAELLMCIGFFTMYFIEECVHVYLRRKQKDFNMDALSRTYSVRRGERGEDGKTISTNNLVKNMEEAKARSEDEQTHDHSHVGHSHLIIEDSVVRSLRGLLVVLALSVHELFEGLAVGLESSTSNVWYMFGAVSAHKLVIAFCIGVELITIQTKVLLTVIYVFTFAIVSPIGIGIGIAISDDQGSADVPSVILQGLASGTLLYIVFFEILQRDKNGGLKQYGAILLGFLIMFGLTFLSKYEKHFKYVYMFTHTRAVR